MRLLNGLRLRLVRCSRDLRCQSDDEQIGEFCVVFLKLIIVKQGFPESGQELEGPISRVN